MSELMKDLKERFLKWISVLESTGLKVNLEKTKVMVCGSEGEVIQSRIDLCRIYGKKVTVNPVLCIKYDQWIQERFSKLKKVTTVQQNFLFVVNVIK